MNDAAGIIDRTLARVERTTIEAVPANDAADIGSIAWTLTVHPPTDTATAVVLAQFIYQLGREQGRREREATGD
jgi:hypothetical protein